MTKKRDLIIVALVTFCLTATSFTVITTRSETPTGTYDPWVDINDDGAINILDAIILANHFATSGTPLTKASMLYDSGWVHVTAESGGHCDITHNLHGPLADKIVDARGIAVGWNRSYGLTLDGAGSLYSLVKTDDGAYALAGEVGAANSELAALIKVDAKGDVQWNKTYEGQGTAGSRSVVQSTGGGYAMTGWSRTSPAASDNLWVVKTDGEGNAEWNVTYGSGRGTTIVETSDGGYAVGGFEMGESDYDFALVRIDKLGNLVWNTTYGTSGPDECLSLVRSSDGGYVLAGYTLDVGLSKYGAWIVKTDLDGKMLWNTTVWAEGENWIFANSVVQASDGDYAVAGSYDVQAIPEMTADFWLAKVDATGTVQWNKTYGLSDWDEARCVTETLDGGFALVGFSGNPMITHGDFWLVKTDALGNVEWNNTYGVGGIALPTCLVQASDGGYVMTGQQLSSLWGQLWLVKTTTQGLAWTDSPPDRIVLYGDETAWWDFVRVQIWKAKE